MITRASKASSQILQQVAAFILGNTIYMKQEFSHCSSQEEVASELRRSAEPWHILVTDQPAALFTLHLLDTHAILRGFCPASTALIEDVISTLRTDLGKLKVESLTLNVPEELAERLARSGAKKSRTLTRLSAPVVETKLMPILPLSNPSEKDIPVLSKLMHESYSKSPEMELQSASSAEKQLRDIMAGLHGVYLPEASLMSGTSQNIVSACFVTLKSSDEASVTQLFTHPLYRARGLATSEVATSMNKLLKRRIPTLTVWVAQNNEVASRLFTKIGFKEDSKSVEMTVPIL